MKEQLMKMYQALIDIQFFDYSTSDELESRSVSNKNITNKRQINVQIRQLNKEIKARAVILQDIDEMLVCIERIEKLNTKHELITA